jgi:hypothetical protein
MSETTPAPNSDEARKTEYQVLISDIPEGERPRERFMAVGAAAMSQRELLAILIRMGPRGVGALALADQLLRQFDGLSGLARADINELQTVHGIGPVKAIEIKAALELGKRMILSAPDQQRTQIKTPGDAAQLLMLEMGMLEQEEVRTLLLDTRNRVLHHHRAQSPVGRPRTLGRRCESDKIACGGGQVAGYRCARPYRDCPESLREPEGTRFRL